MIGKLLVHGIDRTAAIARMQTALEALKVEGIETTAPFHRAVIGDDDFRNNRIRTRWVEEEFLPRWRNA